MSATPSTETAPPQGPGELRRVISRPMLTFFIIGDILGAGIYSLTGEVGGDAGGAIWLSFLIAFALAFLTAFAYLELVTKYPQAAGAALYVDRAFGRQALSFIVTFAVMASGITSAAFAASRIGGRYFTGLTGVENPPTVLIGILAMLLVAAVNLWGVAESIRVNIGITLVELSGLLFIIAVGAVVLVSGEGNPGQAFQFEGSGFGIATGLLAGAGTAFYAFLGFEDAVNLAEETKEPSRTFPPALVTGLVLAGVVYLLVAFTAVMTVPLDVLVASTGPLLEVVREGAPGLPVDRVFSAVSIIAVANTMLINMVMASRLLYGMARRGVVPAPLGRVSRRGAPWVAIAFTTGLAILLLITVSDLSDLSDTTVLLLTGVFLLVNVSALVLRRDAVEHEHFTAPTAALVAGAIVSFVFLLPVVQEGSIYLLAGWLLLGGAVLWAATAAVNRRS
ncbi:APC family permease [Spirilliplanes yamanashiensis]|uniref:Amino acid transporter n=1 Tax=Spirilliplanes yamanashiensis TaxID=42233 RepID=A0A8J4DKG6_9ACTN|nr:APC family permease [Spirilliplanes yamanashiensis]MDP9818823.1 amino acid transporter [Spirilliplanes yamanashiensis]GIJ05277.1 amino acid transporter [Spirilliplanes yamanashiensis]